jgi:Tol biopolymer transport system component/DNA-binding winged helix-turn-helix (wHTH) protein
MNEHATIRPPREILLAYEPAFRLAATQVRPAELEIEGPGGVLALEPRVMKVLVALHRGLGAAVSRETLGLVCWGGRIVSEDALTRCVVQLRKALSSDPGIVLETIPTVGYRLQASEAPAAVGEQRRQGLRPPSLAGLVLTVLLLAAIVPGVWFMNRQPTPWTVRDFRPLTSERSFKTHPAISGDGREVAYAYRATPFGPRDIHLRAVAGGEPIQVTSGADDDYAPAWSPDGRRIAFLRWTPAGACAVMVAIVPRGGEQRLADCRAAWAHPTWLDDRTVVFADTPSDSDLPRLYAVNAGDGQVRQLSSPPADTLGDQEPQASPDGRYVAFRRTLRFGADEIVVLDVRSGRERTLTRDGWKAAGYVWSPDSRNLFFASNRDGGMGLWRIDLRRPGDLEPVSLGLGVVSFMHMSADRAGTVVVEVARPRTGLVRLGSGGEVLSRVVTDSNDWDPVTGPDGAIVHVSDRGGAPEIWVTDPRGRATRLSGGLGGYVFNPTWSPDGQRVAYVAVIGRGTEILTVRRDGSQLVRVTEDGRDKRNPVFDAAGVIHYVEREGQAWRLMSVRPGAAPAPVPGGEGWRAVQASASGRLYGQRQGEDTVGAIQNGTWRPLVAVRPADSWAPADDGLYVLDTSQAAPVLWFQPWTGPRRRLTDPGPWAARLTASWRPGVTLGEALTEGVDLAAMRLGPDRRTPAR